MLSDRLFQGRATGLSLCAILLMSLALPLWAQGDEEPDRLVIVHAGRVITVSGEEITDATIVIRNGVIEAVGKNVEHPYGKAIDARHLTVMPGFINPMSRFAVTASGSGVRPNTKMSKGFKTEAWAFEDVVATGYTNLGLFPRGRGMPGRAMVVHTSGEKPADLVQEDEGPILITFNSPGSEKASVKKAFETAKKEIEKIEAARKKWEEAKKKAAAAAKTAPKAAPKPKSGPAPTPTPKPSPKPTPEPSPKPKETPKPAPTKKPDTKKPSVPKEFVPPKINPAYQPLVDLLQKKEGALAVVEMGTARYSNWGSSLMEGGIYLHWTEIAKEFELKPSYRIYNRRVTRSSPFSVQPETDMELAAETMGKAKPFVALSPVINTHSFTRNKYNLGLTLHNAGCQVVFVPETENWQGYSRMRDALTQMMRSGFPRKAAIESITINPAKMLGVEDRLGSVAVGRAANLVFLDGDPLSYGTRVQKVMIGGKMVDLKVRID